MFEPKENKSIKPAENKKVEEQVNKQVNEQVIKQVKIKMKPGRAAEGVAPDAEGYATVDARMAEYLVKIKYADWAEE